MNELTQQIQISGVENETALSLENIFTPYFQQASEWKEKAEKLVITDASQVKEMQEAREARLALKNIRVAVEKQRVALNEDGLRKTKAINGIANVIKFLIVPIEEHLQKQEDFVKIQEEQRKAQLKEDREKEMAQYEAETTFYDLANMPEETYLNLLTNAKEQYKLKQEVQRKIEEERIAREKAEAEERERVRIENERLRKEAEEREKAIEAERKAQQAELEKQRKEAEEKQKVIEAQLKKEREEREKIEAQRRAEEAEKRRTEEVERKRKEDEEKARIKAEKDAKLAPDKKKLEALAVTITGIEMPEVNSDEAKIIVKSVIELLNKTSNYIREKSLNL